MAAKAQGEIDVVLDANGAPVLKAIDGVVRRIRDIQKVVDQIEAASKRAANAWGGSQPKLQAFDKHLKALEGFEKRLLGAARQPINRGNDDRLFANRVRRVYEFQRGLKDAATTAQAFEARLASLDRKIVGVGNTGKIDSKLMTKRLGLEDAEARFKRLQKEIERTDAMASRAGVRTSRSGVVGAENNLFSALLNPRRDVGRAIEQLRIASGQYQRAVREEMAKIRAAGQGGGAGGGGGGGGMFGGLFGKSGVAGIFARTGAYGGAAAAIYGAISTIKAGLTFAIRFEDSIQKIGAVAGLTNTQMGALGQTIFSVGRNSRFATEDIAEATMVLAQAGFSAQDIEKSLQSVANLAAAAGVSFAEATDVITSAIGSFQLQASEAGRITDVLTAALNNTKLNIQQVALGIQYAGATAYEMKISFEELTAVMATMAQAGIRSGSTIGTGLRQFLVDLQTPTTKLAEKLKSLGLSMADINVKTLGLPEVLNRLAAAGFDASAAYGTLETRAAAAYLVLKNNRDTIAKMTIAQNQVGVAAEAAAKGMDSMAAQWQRFKNILNESVSNGIRPAQNALQSMLETYNELASDKTLQEMEDRLMSGLENDAYKKLDNEIKAYKATLEDNLKIERASRAELEATTTALNTAKDAYETQQTTVESISEAIFKVMLRNQQLKTGSIALSAETASLTSRFAGLASELYGTAASYDNLVLAMQRYRNQAIAIGAMKAQEQAMAAGNQAQAFNRRAAAFGGAFKRSGGLEKLPPKVRDAFNTLVNNPSNLVAQRVVYDFANSPEAKGAFSAPQLNQLRQYATSRGRQSGAAQTYRDMTLQRDIYGQLGTKQGQQELSKLDALAKSGTSQDAIKKQLQVWADQANNPNKSASVRGAMNMLVQQGQSLLGVGLDPQAPEKKAGRAKTDREQDRRQMTIMRERLKATQAALDNAIKNITSFGGGPGEMDGEDIVVSGSKGLTKAQLLKNISKADSALNKWVEHRFDLMNAEIDSANMGGEEAELFKAEVGREIEEKKEATNRAIVEAIAAAMQAMVDAIMQVKEDAEKAAAHVTALGEARVSALERSSLRGRVPDYVKNFYGRQNDALRDVEDRKKIGINEAAISRLQGKIDLNRSLMSSDEMRGKTDALKVLGLQTEEFERQLLELQNANELLKVSFAGEALLPQNFSSALAMAIEDFRELNGLNLTVMETLQNELPNALQAVSEGFATFFTDIITGSKTVKQAFASFVKSMIQYIMQLVAKIIAMKVLQLLLSFLPGASGASAGAAGASSFSGYEGITGSLLSTGGFHGGLVKGAYGGEHIRTGHPGRDSTLRNLAKGEYVVRKAAVDSVGVGYMKRLNEQGKAALPKDMMPVAPDVNQQMAVYIVKEGEKPQMGPNDVLLTVQDDILKDGQTKRLIKLVSQGA